MDIRKTIALHETFELHEIITFKNICATKSAAMSALVKDPELKNLMQQDFRIGQEHIKELSDLLKQAEFKNSPAIAPGMPAEPRTAH